MTPMLLALALSAPPVEPIPPALVPSVAVAGAAVVLGTDALAGRMDVLDRNGPLADRLSDPVLDDARRRLSVIRAFPKPARAERPLPPLDGDFAKRAEELRHRLEENQRQLDEYRERAQRLQALRGRFQLQPMIDRPDFLYAGSLSLIVPASHIHPVIRRELGWTGPNEPWPPRR